MTTPSLLDTEMQRRPTPRPTGTITARPSLIARLRHRPATAQH